MCKCSQLMPEANWANLNSKFKSFIIFSHIKINMRMETELYSASQLKGTRIDLMLQIHSDPNQYKVVPEDGEIFNHFKLINILFEVQN